MASESLLLTTSRHLRQGKPGELLCLSLVVLNEAGC